MATRASLLSFSSSSFSRARRGERPSREAWKFGSRGIRTKEREKEREGAWLQQQQQRSRHVKRSKARQGRARGSVSDSARARSHTGTQIYTYTYWETTRDLPCPGTWAPRSGRPSSRSGRTSCSSLRLWSNLAPTKLSLTQTRAHTKNTHPCLCLANIRCAIYTGDNIYPSSRRYRRIGRPVMCVCSRRQHSSSSSGRSSRPSSSPVSLRGTL